MRTYLLLLVLAGAARAQTASDQQATLAGSVTHAITGQPIPRAHITANGGGHTYGALTDAEGKFTLTPLPPGQYMVSAARSGLTPVAGGSRAAVLLRPGAAESLRLKLTPLGVITGRVLDAAGEPVEFANVTVEPGGTGATTDQSGQYRLGGLRPGKYRVKAAPLMETLPPEIRSDGTEEQHYSATYHGDALTARGAPVLDLRSGADLSGIDIRLVRTPIVAVRGIVTGLANYRNTSVTVFRPDGSGSGTEVRADGSFTIWHLDPGKYVLSAFTQGDDMSRLQSAPLEVEVAGVSVEHLELRMVPAFPLTGQIRFDEEPARPPDARAGQPANRTRPPAVELRAAEGNSGLILNGLLAADDSFALTGVQPGRYHLRLTWPGAYVRSVRAGSTETEGDILDVRNGSPGPVTVSVSSRTAEISGTVRDSNGPVAGASVLLTLPEGRGVTMTRTDAAGMYQFTLLPPGAYVLLAPDADTAAAGNFVTLTEDYADSASKLTLSAGDKATSDLKQATAPGN